MLDFANGRARFRVWSPDARMNTLFVNVNPKKVVDVAPAQGNICTATFEGLTLLRDAETRQSPASSLVTGQSDSSRQKNNFAY